MSLRAQSEHSSGAQLPQLSQKWTDHRPVDLGRLGLREQVVQGVAGGQAPTAGLPEDSQLRRAHLGAGMRIQRHLTLN